MDERPEGAFIVGFKGLLSWNIPIYAVHDIPFKVPLQLTILGLHIRTR